MRRLPRTACLIPAILILSACGGEGGSTPAPTPTPPVNGPPVFTSPASANVAENSSGTIYQAAANDPDSNPLTFSIAGGVDSPRFRITTAGALSFAVPPDFEQPADADGNNVYLVTIAVSDGTTTVTRDLSITVTNVGPDAFRVTRVGAGFVQPVFVAPFPDSSGRVFVVERGGRIRLLNPNSGAVSIFLDISGQTTTDGERGLLGLATAPNFATTGTFYIFLTNLAGDLEIRRYQTFSTQRDIANPGTADAILTIPHPGASNHNGGWIGFGPDDNLYIATGDGGGSGDPANNAQNINVLLGKMLRIDPSVDGFPSDPARDYRIPPGNPPSAGGRPEIWALGLRNPYRASFDAVTGALWIGDVGQGRREEISVMTEQDAGANFGWRVLEGTLVFNGTPTAGMVPPVLEYAHGTGPREGRSVTGGYVYRGPIEALQGQYFFGDFISGNIWSVRLRDITLGTTLFSDRFILRRSDFTPNAGTIGNISSFGVDQAQNLYIVEFDGEIFRVEPQ
ncbi:MAG TPA: PQQ-dependent sugar dehydrogenase [Allosphingosinicella sp.]|nr:PQQ-dependent sugar dehydrogenase [Allosphingosinicella sp.]